MQEKWDLWKRRGHLLLECDDKRATDITDSLFRNDNERRMLIAEAWRTGNYGMLNETLVNECGGNGKEFFFF